MRVLLSTIGSRGDVQPLVALATELQSLGQDVRLCVPPDFRAWIEGLGMPVVPLGPEVRSTGKASPSAAPLSAEVRRKMTEGTVAAQFETLMPAARDCDVIVAATAIQVAARSVAESLGIPYHFAAYCPAVLPSPHHAPPQYVSYGDAPRPAPDEYPALWAQNAMRFNDSFGAALNARRASLGLAPVGDLRSHIFTDRPWLAADPVLAPWPEPMDPGVFQTGAWILPDARPLSRELEAFLDAGEPPIYFGFGSIRAPADLSATMIGAARAVGRRAIVSQGWAELALVDDAADCISIGEVNQQALFPRVAVVVHHGGAGTTTTAARAGAPQVVIPQHYDQPYWALRVEELGIGAMHGPETPTVESLASALQGTLRREIVSRSRSLASVVLIDGARAVAHHIIRSRASSPDA